MPGRRRRQRRIQFLRQARFLEPTLCLLLHRSPSHGYTLLERLEEFGLGTADSGVVYRALRQMEEMSLVTSTWGTEQAQGPRRRVYHLTAQGDRVLGEWVRDLRQTRRQIDHLIEMYDRHMEDGDGEHH